jgi:hypothetical protein
VTLRAPPGRTCGQLRTRGGPPFSTLFAGTDGFGVPGAPVDNLWVRVAPQAAGAGMPWGICQPAASWEGRRFSPLPKNSQNFMISGSQATGST